MELDNSKLPINILLDKINEAAKGNQGITLTDEETKLLSKEVGDLVFIPFLSAVAVKPPTSGGGYKAT